MPKTKGQKLIFGILMSITMTYGMEVYNNAINAGYNLIPGSFSNMTNAVFLNALKESSFMTIIVFIISNFWGNPIGLYLAKKIVRPESDNPFFISMITSCCTVLIMCPTMSLVASIIFNIVLAENSLYLLPAIWVGTVIKNFPMALLWNLFAAGPITRLIYNKLFNNKKVIKNA